MNMSIRENIQQVRENIAAAALSAGRRPEDITLVGASKMNDAAACREAIAAGIDALGEVTIRVTAPDGEVYTGRGADNDIVVSSARAYVNALNRLLNDKREHQQK